MAQPGPSHTVTVHVPMTLRRRGGRKLVVSPAHTVPEPSPKQFDDALIKALARAHHWSRLLETGTYDSIQALAAAEKIDKSYLSKILRLMTLSPAILEMILDGEKPETLDFRRLLAPFPREWERQLDALTGDSRSAMNHRDPKLTPCVHF